MSVINPLLYVVSGLEVACLAVLSFLIMRRLQNKDSTAMVSFQLEQEASIHDFQLMTFSGLPMITGGIIYLLGGFMANNFLKNVGYSFGVLSALTVLYVLYRWWRRF